MTEKLKKPSRNNSPKHITEQKKKQKITYADLDSDFINLENELSDLRLSVAKIQTKLRQIRQKQRKYSSDLSKKAKAKAKEIIKGKTTSGKKSVIKSSKDNVDVDVIENLNNEPLNLSKELCKFLEIEIDVKLTSIEVCKRISTYINKNNLQDKINIKADRKLKALLKVPKGETLTCFNWQTYLEKHYIKNSDNNGDNEDDK